MQIVVAALIKKDGQYLLARRSSGTENIDLWEFPGGKVEADETDEAALAREILEEFNTVVDVGKCIAKTPIDDERELRLYACEHVLGPYRPMSSHSEIVWKKSLGGFYAFVLAPADKALLDTLTGKNKKPHLDELVVGSTYNNGDLSHIFCVSGRGGMRKSNTSNSLVLIARHDNSNPYDDKWQNGEFHYTGMGPGGDQDINYKQNKTLNESRTNGVDLYLFESFNHNEYIYRGRVELCGEPYYETQEDENGKSRQVVKFPLKLIQ